MNLASWLKKLTTGKVIFKATSPVNGRIQVLEDFYGRRLVVGGLTQSGGQVGRIWKRAVSQILKSQFLAPRVLILGLGAGTLAELIFQKWPRAKITGIEIDPEIIKVGKKYFGLDKIFGLKTVIADAAEFVPKKANKERWNLVFVDLYLADQVPFQCETVGFLKDLGEVLAPDGLVFFNRLYYKEHKEKTEQFLDKLEEIFQTIRKKKTGGNLLIFAQRKK